MCVEVRLPQGSAPRYWRGFCWRRLSHFCIIRRRRYLDACPYFSCKGVRLQDGRSDLKDRAVPSAVVGHSPDRPGVDNTTLSIQDVRQRLALNLAEVKSHIELSTGRQGVAIYRKIPNLFPEFSSVHLRPASDSPLCGRLAISAYLI